jgi:hypothetical protein
VRQVIPYRTLRGATKALDNGGRFYNLFSKAHDDVVSGAELARAAGVFSSDVRAFLFFEMALVDLAPDERRGVISALSADMLDQMHANRPRILAPSSVEAEGEAGMPAVVTGYPVFVEDRSEFRGFRILVAYRAVMFLPMIDQFDVYEVYDTLEMKSPRTVIATARGSKRLDGIPTRFAGVLKELQFEDKTGKDHGLFLEAMYYTPLLSVGQPSMAQALPAGAENGRRQPYY